MSKNNFQVGDEVVFVNSEMHEENPEWFPEVGTVGIVVDIYELSDDDYYTTSDDDYTTRVQWPDGSTSKSDVWWVRHEWIEQFCPDQGEIEKSDLPISFLLNVEVGV